MELASVDHVLALTCATATSLMNYALFLLSTAHASNVLICNLVNDTYALAVYV